MTDYLFLSFTVSLIINFIVVILFKRTHIGADETDSGPQKFHKKLTPRIGGLSVFLGFLTSAFLLRYIVKNDLIIYLAVASLPAFLAGFTEDITRKVNAMFRLLATMLSALIVIYVLGVYVNRVDLPFIDAVFQIKVFAYIFTIIAISGVANSFNIIDGYNGLVAVVSIIILIGLAYVAFKVHDTVVLYAAMGLIGATAGFFIWNYPYGLIFLGDGGAYFIGFIAAELCVMLIYRHPQISAWFGLLLFIYPVFETLFSMYRKIIVRKSSPTMPDAFHLHMLIFKRVVPVVFNIDTKTNIIYRNSATSPFLWLLTTISFIPAILFWNNTTLLMISTFVMVVIYIAIYRSIVHYKIDRWLRIFMWK